MDSRLTEPGGSEDIVGLTEENRRLREEIETLRLRTEKAHLELQERFATEMLASQDLRQMWITFGLSAIGTLSLLLFLIAIF